MKSRLRATDIAWGVLMVIAGLTIMVRPLLFDLGVLPMQKGGADQCLPQITQPKTKNLLEI